MNTFDVQREFSHELGAGERLLWSGRPKQGLSFQWPDIFLTVFVLAWLAIPVFGTMSQLRSGNGLFGIVFFLPFFLIGGYILFGRFIVDARQRARTFFGVTTQRILIIVKGRTRHTTTLSLKSIADLTFTEYRNGGGSIQFGSNRWPGVTWLGPSWPGMSEVLAPRFDLDEHARQVYELVRKAQAELSAGN